MNKPDADVEKTVFKRKKILINRKLQFFVIGYFLLNGVLCILITHTVMKMSLNNTLTALTSRNNFSFNHLLNIIETQSHFYNWITLALLGLMSVTFIIGGLYLSHRIAGPIYQLQKNLRLMAEQNNYKEIHFRKGDFLKDLENDFNDYVKAKNGRPFLTNTDDF